MKKILYIIGFLLLIQIATAVTFEKGVVLNTENTTWTFEDNITTDSIDVLDKELYIDNSDNISFYPQSNLRIGIFDLTNYTQNSFNMTYDDSMLYFYVAVMGNKGYITYNNVNYTDNFTALSSSVSWSYSVSNVTTTSSTTTTTVATGGGGSSIDNYLDFEIKPKKDYGNVKIDSTYIGRFKIINKENNPIQVIVKLPKYIDINGQSELSKIVDSEEIIEYSVFTSLMDVNRSETRSFNISVQAGDHIEYYTLKLFIGSSYKASISDFLNYEIFNTEKLKSLNVFKENEKIEGYSIKLYHLLLLTLSIGLMIMIFKRKD